MYCYQYTDVLINNLYIRDKAELKQAEEEFTAVKQMALLQEPIKGRFTKTHLFRIHRFLDEQGDEFEGVFARVWKRSDTLVFLAFNSGIVLTRTQIFEAVWNMDSDSCHLSVGNVIYNLRKKIEPDSKNPTYIKTILGVGYKFDG